MKSWIHILCALACLLLWYPQPGRAETGQLNEHEVKTAYLYNFAKYVEWPQSALTGR